MTSRRDADVMHEELMKNQAASLDGHGAILRRMITQDHVKL